MSVIITFIKKALFVDPIPEFAAAKGQFINEVNILTASHKFMKSHLTEHMQGLYDFSMQYIDLKLLPYSNVAIILGNTLTNITTRSLSKRYLSFKTKNQRIDDLVKQKKKPCSTNFFVPILKLSKFNLSNQENQQLILGLHYYFADKNKDVWKFPVANMESSADSIKGRADHINLEYFQKFLHGYTDISSITFTLQNIIHITTYKIWYKINRV